MVNKLVNEKVRIKIENSKYNRYKKNERFIELVDLCKHTYIIIDTFCTVLDIDTIEYIESRRWGKKND